MLSVKLLSQLTKGWYLIFHLNLQGGFEENGKMENGPYVQPISNLGIHPAVQHKLSMDYGLSPLPIQRMNNERNVPLVNRDGMKFIIIIKRT